jgi:hypothetical protein
MGTEVKTKREGPPENKSILVEVELLASVTLRSKVPRSSETTGNVVEHTICVLREE